MLATMTLGRRDGHGLRDGDATPDERLADQTSSNGSRAGGPERQSDPLDTLRGSDLGVFIVRASNTLGGHVCWLVVDVSSFCRVRPEARNGDIARGSGSSLERRDEFLESRATAVENKQLHAISLKLRE